MQRKLHSSEGKNETAGAAEDGTARLLIINPNSSESMTRRIHSEARRVFGSLVHVDAVTAARGPRYVETHADEVVAGEAVLELVRQFESRSPGDVGDRYASKAIEGPPASASDYDAYIIGCFSDPGLTAVREVTSKPVIGFGEATLFLAHGLGVDFALLCNVDADVPDTREMAARYGLDGRLAAVRPAGYSIGAFDHDDPRAIEALKRVAREVVERDHVGAVCLGCAVFVELRQALSEDLHVPVLEGMTAAVELAHFYVRLSSRHSSVGKT